MSDKILVTYASRTGTTAGVADAIGATLKAHGLQVEVRPMSEVSDLAPYRAVVAGSAIQGKAWLPEAMTWVQSHRVDLSRKPFASFLVCITLAAKNTTYHQAVADWLAPVRALVHPVSEGMFAGALDLPKVPSLRQRLGFRASIALGVWSEGDHRDWNAVRAWAEALVPKL